MPSCKNNGLVVYVWNTTLNLCKENELRMVHNRFQGSEQSKIIRTMEKRLNMCGSFHTPLLVRVLKKWFFGKMGWAVHWIWAIISKNYCNSIWLHAKDWICHTSTRHSPMKRLLLVIILFGDLFIPHLKSKQFLLN